MSNEITFGFKIGRTLTYGVYQPDGTVRTAADTPLSEVSGTGYYKASNADIIAGDIVVVKESTNVVGYGEYRPEANCVLIEGDDFTDTLIGADGDTLETLSDQMDTVTANQERVLNVYDERKPL